MYTLALRLTKLTSSLTCKVSKHVVTAKKNKGNLYGNYSFFEIVLFRVSACIIMKANINVASALRRCRQTYISQLCLFWCVDMFFLQITISFGTRFWSVTNYLLQYHWRDIAAFIPTWKTVSTFKNQTSHDTLTTDMTAVPNTYSYNAVNVVKDPSHT